MFLTNPMRTHPEPAVDKNTCFLISVLFNFFSFINLVIGHLALSGF